MRPSPLPGHLSRRAFVRASLAASLVPVLAACGQAAPPSPTAPSAASTTAPPTQAPSSAAPAATSAPAATPTTQQQPATSSQPSGGAKKITFLIYGGKAEQDAWNAKGAAFAKKYPGRQVEVIIPPGNYNEKLLAMIASNTAPDTFAAFSVRELAPKGILMPLDERLKGDKDFNVDDFLAGALDGGKWKGVQYAIPGGLGPQVTFFNVAKFKEAGLQTPNELAASGSWDYNKLLEVCQKLTTKDSNGKVKTFGYLPYTQFYTYTYGAGANTFNKDYTECYLDAQEATDALQFYADLSLKQHVAPLNAEMQQYGSWQGFAQGNYGIFISGPWQQARLGANMKDPWDIAPPPLQQGGIPIMNSGGNGTAAYAKTPDPDTSYKWVTFSESQEGQRIWAGLGFDIPSRKSLVDDYSAGKFFSDPKFKPEHVKLWYEIVPKSVPSPHTYLPSEASDKLNAAWTNVSKGTGSAKDEFKKIVADINQILKDK